MFGHEEINDLDMGAVVEAFNDPEARNRWLIRLFEELKSMNLEVDRRLLAGSEAGFNDLCSRRKQLQDVLTSILSAKRTVGQRAVRTNPQKQTPVVVDLDRVTA